jgi:uncharacterized membrane protein
MLPGMHGFVGAQSASHDASERPAAAVRGRHSSLFRTYLVVLMALVAVVLLLSGVVQSVITSRDSRDALIRLQRAQATAIAIQIR